MNEISCNMDHFELSNSSSGVWSCNKHETNVYWLKKWSIITIMQWLDFNISACSKCLSLYSKKIIAKTLGPL